MTKRADPKTPPPVPADVDAYLEKLGLPPETRAYAKYLYPSPGIETEAQQLEREREQAQKVDRVRHLSELVRHALAGRDGASVREAVRQVLADRSLDRTAQLEQCGRIIERNRAAQKAKPTPRGRYAP